MSNFGQSTSMVKGCMHTCLDTVDTSFTYAISIDHLQISEWIFQGKRKYSAFDLKCTYCIFTLWGRVTQQVSTGELSDAKPVKSYKFYQLYEFIHSRIMTFLLPWMSFSFLLITHDYIPSYSTLINTKLSQNCHDSTTTHSILKHHNILWVHIICTVLNKLNLVVTTTNWNWKCLYKLRNI